MTPEQLAKGGSEHAHQSALMCWCALNISEWPDLKWLFAIPNGGDRDKRVAANMVAEGVKKGVADLFLPVPKGGYPGLWIEMKRPGCANRLSEKQVEFRDDMWKYGYGHAVCDNWEKARDVLIQYLSQ